MTIAPGSVTFPNGSKNGLVSVTVVHADKMPMVPSFGRQPRFLITIQPAGAHFEPPAAIQFPNVDALAPGQITELFSFDHDLGQFVSIGTASVSEDGMVLRSDAGVGILKAGWHGGGGPADSGDGEPVTVKILSPEEAGAEPRPIQAHDAEREARAVTMEPSGERKIRAGQTVTITAEGRPVSDIEQPFTWTSSDPQIASIDGSPQNTKGEESIKSVVRVTGNRPGMATITVRYKTDPSDSKKVQTAEVKVIIRSAEFRVRYAQFITENYVPNPPILPGLPGFSCVDGVVPRSLVYEGDDRGFDPTATSYRSIHEFTLVSEKKLDEDGIKEGTEFKNTNISRSYASNALEDGRVSPLPVASGGDQDLDTEGRSVLSDCFLLHGEAQQTNFSWTVQSVTRTEHALTVLLTGNSVNPLPLFSAGISWNFTLTIDTSEEIARWTLNGTHDCFPAHELYINGQPIHQRAPTDHSFTTLSNCLIGRTPAPLNTTGILLE
jgi:antitoxin (DNA-binding transcriptional repressor) of toxin-antitoxin stability system